MSNKALKVLGVFVLVSTVSMFAFSYYESGFAGLKQSLIGWVVGAAVVGGILVLRDKLRRIR